jgi:crotonobetainyl-CoA:carnitine CoA-transferase CaiB-like acyl-CoA transferase
VTTHGPLGGYRALDLTDHRGALAGRVLADLGVDVVKVSARADSYKPRGWP